VNQQGERRLELAVLRGRLTIEEERTKAAPLVTDLLEGRRGAQDLSAEEWLLLRGVAGFDLCLARSSALRHTDPTGMLRHAQAGLAITQAVSVRRYGAKVRADLVARAWGELGNARRVGDDLTGAEEALVQAAGWAQRGSGELGLAARLMDLAASLASDQRRFSDAIEAAHTAAKLYLDAGEIHLAARALISKGMFTCNSDDPAKAVIWLRRGLKHLDCERAPAVEITAVETLTMCLIDLGRFDEARQVLVDNLQLYYRDSDRLIRLRRSWREGKIAFGLDELRDAEASFQATRRGFAEVDQHFDAALVGLDLALVYVRQGRTWELVELVDEMVSTFRALGIAREAIAGLLLLRKVCQQPEASDDLLRGQIQAIAALLAEMHAKTPGRRAD